MKTFPKALKKVFFSFAATFPLLMGVILLVGGVQAMVTPQMLASLIDTKGG